MLTEIIPQINFDDYAIGCCFEFGPLPRLKIRDDVDGRSVKEHDVIYPQKILSLTRTFNKFTSDDISSIQFCRRNTGKHR